MGNEAVFFPLSSVNPWFILCNECWCLIL